MEEFIAFTLRSRRTPRRSCGRSIASCRSSPIDEWVAPHLKGYRGDGPVRVGNAAAARSQNDTYGSIILAAMPMFFDRRLPRPGDEGLFELLEVLGGHAAKLALRLTPASGNIAAGSVSTPIRSRCAGPAAIGSRPSRRGLISRIARSIGTLSLRRSTPPCWRRRGTKAPAFTAAFGSDDLDASVLLLPDLGIIEAEDPRFVTRWARWSSDLLREKHVMRYTESRRFRPSGHGVSDLPLLADRCLVVARPPAATRKRSVRGCAQPSQSLWPSVRRRRSAVGGVVGQFSADLFDGRAYPYRDAAVPKLGRPLLAVIWFIKQRPRPGFAARADRRALIAGSQIDRRCSPRRHGKACGKLPTMRPCAGSYSSLSRPSRCIARPGA